MTSGRPIAFVNARLVDPDSRYDGPGAIRVEGGLIADVVSVIGSNDVVMGDCDR